MPARTDEIAIDQINTLESLFAEVPVLRECDLYGSTASSAIMPLKIALSLFGYVIHPLFSGRYSERPLDSSAFGADRPRQEHRRQS